MQRLRAEIDACSWIVPFPVWDVAEAAGWTVERWPGLLPCLGFVIVVKHVTLCVIDESLPRRVQRFVLAHEMGHVLAGHVSAMSLCWPTWQRGDLGAWISRRQEREADKWAAQLLVPVQAMKETLDAQELADLCEIPKWLADVRLGAV